VTIQQFVEELQRRHVFKVVGGYLVASWVAIEVSNTIFQILALVDAQKYSRYVLIACAIGLPFAFILSWMFDFTKEGIVRTPRWVPPAERDALLAPDGRTIEGAPHRGVALSGGASGMFGLGVLVAIVSLAAYTRVVHTPDASTASGDSARVSAIAVMPLEDISEKHDQKYFADGMTEELLSRLAQVENLQIVSGEGYATPTRGGDLQTVATRLNVQAILQGSVARAEDSVRVSVKLINPSTNKVLYAQTFTRPTSNIFQVQDEIAEAVAGSLKLQTTADVAKGEGDLETTNPEAFALYAKGLQSLDARTEPELRKAIQYFDSATKLDMKWAKPYAGLAQTYAVLPTISRMSFEEAGTKGNSAAASAIANDPNLPEAYAALGQIAQNISWNLHMAENFYQRAIKDRGSKYAPGHQWYAETLAMLGRTDEALKEINIALQLKPGSPASRNTLGYVLTIRGDLDSALSVFRSEGSLYPEYKLGHLTHALTALTAGRYDEALQAAQNYAGTDAALANTMSTVIRGAAGTVPRAEAIRAAASLEPRLGAGFTALWFGALKDRPDAMKMVQKAYDGGKDATFPYFVIHPLLGILKDDPAYMKVVNDMGVVPAR
jgi:serine/threonine-protein kinase